MERIAKMKLKAENDKGKAELEIERLEQTERDKEAESLNKKRESVKLQAQLDHEAYLVKQQQLRNQKEYEKSNIGRTRESFRHAKEIKDRDISRGLTWEQREYKNMDSKTRRECDNAIAQGDAKDIRDFLRKERLKKEASEQRRRRLKGL